MRMPVLFLSHGSPMVLIEPSPHRDFLTGLAATLPRPTAILSVTAHWTTPDVRVSETAKPRTFRDFGGFPDELYRVDYLAPGHPELAAKAHALLTAAGFRSSLADRKVLDHGTWIPLALAWPEADVPVVEMSVQPGHDARHHLAVGRALTPLREQGVMIVGSGSLTHNLRDFSQMPLDMPFGYADLFAEWLTEKIVAGDCDAVAEWQHAPFADRAHPTDEHFLPLPVAMGAGNGRGRRIFEGSDGPALRLDCFVWDDVASLRA
jgi:4,5-DOPA dioxygenase extradiol